MSENAPATTIVYQTTVQDTDGDRMSWSLTGTDQALFTIDWSGGVRLIEPADFETRSSYSFNVVAANSAGAA